MSQFDPAYYGPPSEAHLRDEIYLLREALRETSSAMVILAALAGSEYNSCLPWSALAKRAEELCKLPGRS